MAINASVWQRKCCMLQQRAMSRSTPMSRLTILQAIAHRISSPFSADRQSGWIRRLFEFRECFRTSWSARRQYRVDASGHGLTHLTVGHPCLLPWFSGAAGLVLSGCSGLTTAQLRADLLATVDPISSLAGRTATGGSA